MIIVSNEKTIKEVYNEFLLYDLMGKSHSILYRGREIFSSNYKEVLEELLNESLNCEEIKIEKFYAETLNSIFDEDERKVILASLSLAPITLKYYIERGKSYISDDNNKLLFAMLCYKYYAHYKNSFNSIKIAVKLLMIKSRIGENEAYDYRKQVDEIMFSISSDDKSEFNEEIIQRLLKIATNDDELYNSFMLNGEINNTKEEIDKIRNRK